MKTHKAMRFAVIRLRRFVTHTGGSLTIPAIVFFVMLMGVGGLTIDLQRLYGVHGQMQAYVDDVALAAAAELDGQSGAIGRAIDAATGGTNGPLVTGANWQKFQTHDPSDLTAVLDDLGIRELIFLSALVNPDPAPTDPNDPYPGDTVLCTIAVGAALPACATNANANKNARFVEVLAAPRTMKYVVLPVADVIGRLFGAPSITSQATLALRATAGFTQSVCDINPMMICNPSEPASNTDTNYPYTPAIGTQILVRAGGGSSWTPGDFGWVDVPNDAGITGCDQGGSQDIGCVLGLVNPLTQCFNNNKINVKPGQTTPTADGLNARFDIYPNNNKIGPANNVSTDSNFAPSVNATKGICNIKNGKCDYSGSSTCPKPNEFSLSSTVTDTAARSVKMPRDQGWDASGRFGNGVWDRAGYWASNHGKAALPASLASATRYQVYRHEIDCTTGAGSCLGLNDGIPNYSPSSDNGESGNHVGSGNGKWCSNQAGVNTPARDRRTLFVAVVNCKANGLQGNSKTGVTAVTYIKMFLTEPVGFKPDGTWDGNGSTKDVYAEVIDVIKPHDQSNIVHIYPVLYR